MIQRTGLRARQQANFGGQPRMLQTRKIRTVAPDTVAYAQSVRRQEREQVLAPIGDHTQLQSRPALKRKVTACGLTEGKRSVGLSAVAKSGDRDAARLRLR